MPRSSILLIRFFIIAQKFSERIISSSAMRAYSFSDNSSSLAILFQHKIWDRVQAISPIVIFLCILFPFIGYINETVPSDLEIERTIARQNAGIA